MRRPETLLLDPVRGLLGVRRSRILARRSKEDQTRTMQGTLLVDGSESPATTSAVAALVTAGTAFWLDLDGVDAEASALLGRHCTCTPWRSRTRSTSARPKIEEFDNFTYFVVHGALEGGAGTSGCTSSSCRSRS